MDKTRKNYFCLKKLNPPKKQKSQTPPPNINIYLWFGARQSWLRSARGAYISLYVGPCCRGRGTRIDGGYRLPLNISVAFASSQKVQYSSTFDQPTKVVFVLFRRPMSTEELRTLVCYASFQNLNLKRSVLFLNISVERATTEDNRFRFVVCCSGCMEKPIFRQT